MWIAIDFDLEIQNSWKLIRAWPAAVQELLHGVENFLEKETRHQM